MRQPSARALRILLLAPFVACDAPPPTVATTQTVSAPAPRERWIEITGTAEKATLVGHRADGEAAYKVDLGVIHAAARLPDGGAIVVATLAPKAAPTVVRIDAEGQKTWTTALGALKRKFRVGVVGDRVFVFDFGYAGRDNVLRVLGLEAGDEQRAHALDPSVVDAAFDGEVLVVATEDRVIRVRPSATDLPAKRIASDPTAWEVRLRSYPSTLPSGLAPDERSKRVVAVGVGGVVLTGGYDGSVVAVSAAGAPRFQLGIREAVKQIVARGDGDFLVIGATGSRTLVGPSGEVRKEDVAQVAIDPGGVGVVDRRIELESVSTASSTGVADRRVEASRRTAGYRVERVAIDGEPLVRVDAVLATARDDVWVLASKERQRARGEPDPHLFHFDARGWTDLGPPTVDFKREIFADGLPASVGAFFGTRLARGPSGAVEILGVRRAGETSRPALLERTAKGFRERREPFDVFVTATASDFGYACSASGVELVCVASSGALGATKGDPRCVTLHAGHGAVAFDVTRARRLDAPDSGAAPRGRGPDTMLLFAGDTPWFGLGVAAGDRDAWFAGKRRVIHWNGEAFTKQEAPPLGPEAESLSSVWATGPDDVWATGSEGLARFDGKAWWRIAELDSATFGGSNLEVTVRGGTTSGCSAVSDSSTSRRRRPSTLSLHRRPTLPARRPPARPSTPRRPANIDSSASSSRSAGTHHFEARSTSPARRTGVSSGSTTAVVSSSTTGQRPG